MSSRPGIETSVKSYAWSHYAIYRHAECMKTTLNYTLIHVQTKMVTHLTQISNWVLPGREDTHCYSRLTAWHYRTQQSWHRWWTRISAQLCTTGQEGMEITTRWGEILRTCPDWPWGPPSLWVSKMSTFITTANLTASDTCWRLHSMYWDLEF